MWCVRSVVRGGGKECRQAFCYSLSKHAAAELRGRSSAWHHRELFAIEFRRGTTLPSDFLTSREEPTIDVGLVDCVAAAQILLTGSFRTDDGQVLPAGELRVRSRSGVLYLEGVGHGESQRVRLTPVELDSCQFSMEATIGINFHWQQREMQVFRGGLQVVPMPGDRLTVINRVPLETYLRSVVCSEMKASAPREFIKAHAIISRSWLLSQLVARDSAPQGSVAKQADFEGERIRWTERDAHAAFDVCADDHCQRYQGIARIDAPGVVTAIDATRGEVLMYGGFPCDARFSKSCGGVSEEFPTAWGEQSAPYLVALRDNRGSDRRPPLLYDDASMREFLGNPPDSYCDCHVASILGAVLNDYDLTTKEFFRWRVRLTASDATRLVCEKLGIDLGRILNLVPVERGPSGRLMRLRLVGERGSLVIGKELEIRRALSESHLYSSAFVVDAEGPAGRPDAFVLTGAGWGHGVGLCQIGAAVMAHEGIGCHAILEHYYPGAGVERLYG